MEILILQYSTVGVKVTITSCDIIPSTAARTSVRWQRHDQITSIDKQTNSQITRIKLVLEGFNVAYNLQGIASPVVE